MISLNLRKGLFLSGFVAVLSMLVAVSGHADVLLKGDRLYVTADILTLRNTPSVSGQSLGKLQTNDMVIVIDTLGQMSDYVQVKVLISKTVNPKDIQVPAFVAKSYLSKSKAVNTQDPTIPSKYFLVQNIATERARVYERCMNGPQCKHRLIMETEMVAGRPGGDMTNPNRYKSMVGHYKIKSWKKFYEDNQRHYPSYYNPNYPPVPYSGGLVWLSQSLIPQDIKQLIQIQNQQQGLSITPYRGAFGWYTAFVTPVDESQWVHGTYGWGHEGNAFIKRTRENLTNLVSDPQSHGCTRVENQAIAFMRSVLADGSDVIRVYAKEAIRAEYENQPVTQYPEWHWILTKEGVNVNGPVADAADVLARNVPPSEYLEQGVYKVKNRATPVGFTAPAFIIFKPLKGKTCMMTYSGKTGNTYCVEENAMKGVYLVDEGKFVEYQHPISNVVRIGGFEQSKQMLPEYLNSWGERISDGKFKMPPRPSINETGASASISQ